MAELEQLLFDALHCLQEGQPLAALKEQSCIHSQQGPYI